MAWRFPIRYFLDCYSERFKVFDLLKSVSKYFFFVLFIHSAILLFIVPIFYNKIVLFLMNQVVDLSLYILLLEFFFVILEYPIWFVLLDFASVSFESPFFHQFVFLYLFKLNFYNCLLFYLGLFFPT